MLNAPVGVHGSTTVIKNEKKYILVKKSSPLIQLEKAYCRMRKDSIAY
jgi:hypothetical protein